MTPSRARIVICALGSLTAVLFLVLHHIARKEQEAAAYEVCAANAQQLQTAQLRQGLVPTQIGSGDWFPACAGVSERQQGSDDSPLWLFFSS